MTRDVPSGLQIGSFAGLLATIRARGGRLIAIDGYHGVGKSTLAQALGHALRRPVVSLDDFVRPEQGEFMAALDHVTLSAAVQGEGILVEGVCMLSALQRISRQPDLFIYVQPGMARRPVRFAMGTLDQEVQRYHETFRPQSVADVIYCHTGAEGDRNLMPATREDVEIAFIQAQSRVAIALSIGGVVALLVGLALLVFGTSGDEQAVLKTSVVEVSARGTGAVIMVTSAVWGYFAFRCLPSFTKDEKTVERFGPSGKLIEKSVGYAATQVRVNPARRQQVEAQRHTTGKRAPRAGDEPDS